MARLFGRGGTQTEETFKVHHTDDEWKQILNPHQFHSRELRQYATFLKRIRQGDLAASQFPKTLTDRKGTFAKPSGW